MFADADVWPEIASLTLAAMALSAVLTRAIRRMALSRGNVDVPNARSSHTVPTPRGGGVAIVLTTLLALTALLLLGRLALGTYIAIAGGGLAVAAVGFFDDRYNARISARLAVHVFAAVWALVWLGGLPPLQLGQIVMDFGWSGYAIGTVLIVWVLNLFNFMDGIDGLAASEAAFVAWGAALLWFMNHGDSPLGAALLLFGAACAGFLIWNWPPASIFLGDVGSGYLGYFLIVVAIAATREHPGALLSWMLLAGIFILDATVTLARRVLRGEAPHVAHRTHAYQWLARTWQSHRRVTLTVLAVNVIWLFPLALLTDVFPVYAPFIALGGLAPVVMWLLLAGAGRPERSNESRTSETPRF